MVLRKKHALVIFFSSTIIAIVLVTTLAGYSLYVQWKKDSFALKYRRSIYKLTADLFKKDVAVYNVSVRIGDNELFSGMPILEGSLKNNSGKTITSILVEISFLKGDGAVIYHDWFHVLGEKHYGSPPAFSEKKQAGNVLLPGEGISFRHLLRNCPREVIDHVTVKSQFAKSHPKDSMKMVYSITGMSVR